MTEVKLTDKHLEILAMIDYLSFASFKVMQRASWLHGVKITKKALSIRLDSIRQQGLVEPVKFSKLKRKTLDYLLSYKANHALTKHGYDRAELQSKSRQGHDLSIGDVTLDLLF
jgi:hypothetical protein